MTKLNYSKYCIEQLFKSIPEIKNLKGALKASLEDSMGELNMADKAHHIYEEILCQYFLSLVKQNDAKNKRIISKILALIEHLAKHEDFEVRCVAQVSFIEPLLDKINPYSDIEKYLFPESLELAKEIAMERFGVDYKLGWKKII